MKDLIFIKVVGDDGVFYDLVPSSREHDHLRHLRADGYEAEAVKDDDVPATMYRDFTASASAYLLQPHAPGGSDAADLVFYHEA